MVSGPIRKYFLTSHFPSGVNLKILRVLVNQVDSKILILKNMSWMMTGKIFLPTRMTTISVIMCCARILTLMLMMVPGRTRGLVGVQYLEHFLVIKIVELMRYRDLHIQVKIL